MEWGLFNLNDSKLFNLSGTKSGIDKIKLNLNGECRYPFVTRTEKSNGIDSLVPIQEKPLNQGNTISIGLDTQTVFYQEKPYYSGQNIQVFEVFSLSEELAMFLIPIIKNQLKYLNWGGNGATLSRLRAKKILLPCGKEGSPDWKYMEQYIINIMAEIRVPEVKPWIASTLKLNVVEWKEFQLNEIMKIFNGVRLTNADMKCGKIPFIGATDSNNGITNWTSDINTSTDSNVLGVNYNGSVGEVFYHPYKATFSDDVKRLKLIKKYSYTSSKEVYLFLKTIILQQTAKYKYGYKFNNKRISKQKVMLPVTDEGTPDWQFMEDYIRSIPNSNLI